MGITDSLTSVAMDNYLSSMENYSAPSVQTVIIKDEISGVASANAHNTLNSVLGIQSTPNGLVASMNGTANIPGVYTPEQMSDLMSRVENGVARKNTLMDSRIGAKQSIQQADYRNYTENIVQRFDTPARDTTIVNNTIQYSTPQNILPSNVFPPLNPVNISFGNQTQNVAQPVNAFPSLTPMSYFATSNVNTTPSYSIGSINTYHKG